MCKYTIMVCPLSGGWKDYDHDGRFAEAVQRAYQFALNDSTRYVAISRYNKKAGLKSGVCTIAAFNDRVWMSLHDSLNDLYWNGVEPGDWAKEITGRWPIVPAWYAEDSRAARNLGKIWPPYDRLLTTRFEESNMYRLEYRWAIAKALDLKVDDLAAFCVECHGYATGASEVTTKVMKAAYRFIGYVLQSWDYTATSMFDNMVRNLAIEAQMELYNAISKLG